MTMTNRRTPNPKSELLAGAIIGGAGIGLPPSQEAPEGRAFVLLLVPQEQVLGRTALELQNDIGLPWHMEGGEGVWLDELMAESIKEPERGA